MQIKLILLPLLSYVLLISCQQSHPIEGLWVVKLVKAGEQEMTPNARWTRFNADYTHETGNGRLEHSYGSWAFNQAENELSVKTLNGLHDPSPPFTVKIEGDHMYWSRLEEGQNIEVTLQRADRLPETYGDRLLGLWKLEEAVGAGKHFEETNGQNSSDYLFLKWDRKFTVGTKKGRTHGVYNVHGHKPQLELIPYGDGLEREFWAIQYGADTFTLQRLYTDSTVTRTFIRIHEFPEQ